MKLKGVARGQIEVCGFMSKCIMLSKANLALEMSQNHQEEKSEILGREGERERLASLGGHWWPWSSAIGAQGSCLACPRIMAQRVEAMVCVCA